MTESDREQGAMPRRVDVFELARRGSGVDGEAPISAFERVMPSLASGRGSVQFAFRCGLDDRGRLAASLRFGVDVDFLCDRCGHPVPWRLEGASRFWFVHTEEELAGLPVDESDEEPLLGSARFDLWTLLEDELLLALPMSPRHPDCRSLQLTAAASSVEPSPERSAGRPHPFAALARLKARRS